MILRQTLLNGYIRNGCVANAMRVLSIGLALSLCIPGVCRCSNLSSETISRLGLSCCFQDLLSDRGWDGENREAIAGAHDPEVVGTEGLAQVI
jgi:hypothetical protein